ncbi:kinase phosphorylation protein-domain-containing protein [Mycena sp. CBHHK59/15]|nr:kinase phosphorylation protein-domain-containing protein [Mycena sp. CBHHK59/15]
MFEPIRGGTRGGQAEFKWSDVSADKDRENYLGHSINAPTGRWQKNKDVHWYNRDLTQADAERAEEIRKIKEAEADALAVALGFAPTPKTTGGPSASVGSASPKSAAPAAPEIDYEKAERRRKKAEHKEEKRAKKEARRLVRASDPEYDDRRRRDRNRSRSPLRRASLGRERERERRRASPARSRSPIRRTSRSPARRTRSRTRSRSPEDYGAAAREQERARARRRWDATSRREQPGSAQWGRG